MDKSEAPSLPDGVSVTDFAVPQTKRMPEELVSGTASRKNPKMCSDEDSTTNHPDPGYQSIKYTTFPNPELPLKAALWEDTARKVYERLKDRAEKLKDDPASKKDTPDAGAPSEDGPQCSIFETLPGRVQTTLNQLHDKQEQKEMEQSIADDTSSALSSLSSSRLSSPYSGVSTSV